MPRTGLVWSPPPVVIAQRVISLGPGIRSRFAKKLQGFAATFQAEMKSGAPWTDRTGQTRASLSCRASVGANEGVLSFSVSGPGSPWVEIANQGRFAIVVPTIQSAGPRVMAGIGPLL